MNLGHQIELIDFILNSYWSKTGDKKARFVYLKLLERIPEEVMEEISFKTLMWEKDESR